MVVLTELKGNIAKKYEDSADVLKVMAHPVRLGLLEIMQSRGPLNVTAMYEEFDMPQSTISQHLSKLKQAKIIAGTRKGLEVYYRVVDDRAKALLNTFVS
ncbi:ArsR/SmtB family transcription factor [Microbacteriaceae bacterium 4G12]